MDEATSSLDVLTEKKIVDNLMAMTDKTIVFVAHRLSIAQSYGPDEYMERNRSRTYAGIKHMDGESPVTYKDKYYDLLRTPTAPNKRYAVQDVIGEQRNRFENLPEFLPDDTVEVGKDYDTNVYKYALGNENVIDAHIYQIKSDLPSEFGGVLWLGLAQSRNTPYVPFYGNVTDTYEAFKNRSEKYDGKSWYWSVWHIDQMVMKYPDIFDKSIQDKWKAKEEEWVKEESQDSNCLQVIANHDTAVEPGIIEF